MFRRVVPLFFLSGISGLIYQVLWVRQFGNVFGNTVHSASVVTAVFMLGLGLGSYLGGIWADRNDGTRALRAYGLAEVSIGVLGVVLAGVLPLLGPLAARMTTYAPIEHGWSAPSLGSLALRYVVATLLIGLPTSIMGATLTLLIRFVVQREVSRAGFRVGVLYGANTLGAALGAFLTDFALVPNMGLFATASVAGLVNLCAGLGALRLTAGVAALPAASSEPARWAEEAPASSERGALLRYTRLALFFSGFAGMGLEIVWFRFLGSVIGHHRSIFSLLLTVILLGIWAGSTLGGYLHRRFGRAALFYVAGQALLVPAALFGLTRPSRQDVLDAFYYAQETYAASSTLGRALIVNGVILRPILAAVALPAVLMGLTYPLANATVQRAEASVGRRSGGLYLANTAGAVLGSLVVGFVLLPGPGQQVSALVVMGAVALGLASYFVATRSELPKKSGLRVALPAALLFGTALVAWSRLPSDFMFREAFLQLRDPDRKVLAMREGLTELIAVTEDKAGDRALNTDGYSMSGTNLGAQRYMRAFAHLPLLMSDDPRAALVICFGVGNTLHAASLHHLERLELVDISRDVLEHGHFFAATNGDVLEKGRASIYVNDGRNHLLIQPPETYDLVTLEPPPISVPGVASLYSRDFYEIVRSRLKEGGYLSQWLPAYQVSAEVNLSIVRAFLDVFPSAVLLSGAGNELILLGKKGDAIELDPEAFARHLADKPRVQEDLARIELGTVSEVVATFAGSAATLAQATEGVAPVMDDFPSMEYGAHVMIGHKSIPASLFDVSRVGDWCPKCFAGGAIKASLAELGPLLESARLLYQSRSFLQPGN